ncbi:MAG TPA: CsiV family protein [Steroidobacteraceae bacterium]|nr:CsiV family protein [Steroidobacteraceae bacterium]
MKPHSRIVRRLACGALLALCAATALPQAPAPLYAVEIVVFRNGGTIGALPDDAPAPTDAADDVDATPIATGKLNAAAAKLRKGGFEVLAHKAWTQAATAWDSGHGVSTRLLGLGDAIDGKISVERGEKLNLRLDLTVRDGGRRYRINEVRRNLKTGQIQYFDHPAVGVLAIVTPAGATPTG